MAWNGWCQQTISADSCNVRKLCIYGFSPELVLWGTSIPDFVFENKYLNQAKAALEKDDAGFYAINGVHEPNGTKYIFVRFVASDNYDAIVGKNKETNEVLVILVCKKGFVAGVFKNQGAKSDDVGEILRISKAAGLIEN